MGTTAREHYAAMADLWAMREELASLQRAARNLGEEAADYFTAAGNLQAQGGLSATRAAYRYHRLGERSLALSDRYLRRAERFARRLAKVEAV